MAGTQDDSPVIVSSPEGIEFARLLSIIGRLKIETRTGLKFRISTLKAAQRLYGLQDVRTKRDMLATLENVRDMVLNENHILWPAGDGTIGLYERPALMAELGLTV